MIIKLEEVNKYYKVYALFYGNNNEKYYWTDKGHVYNSYYTITEISEFTNRNTFEYNNYKYESEDEKINGWYLDKELSDDFKNEEEKKQFKKIKLEVDKILPEIYKRIEIDYINWQVKNNKLEKWKNNFEEKVYEVSETERFIDDEEYDIFYNINNLEEIKIVEKIKK